ncbi:helix-turn-helix transcriptional regulator [Marinivivus vitaminiproducens]|uniref:helix-turn-helix transcriptional regulator n=1 Tax=Marinivivus vitaminiproducens TaxID=3035935 RepID=UPI0027A434A0|nr:helix-turn-helix transcriptional regulator [Geminicoccaceae bacterium SCSIO 64248]
MPIELWNRVVAAAEDAADIEAYDEAKRAIASGESELVPFETMQRIWNGGEHPVRVWREHRGMTQSALAQAAGVAQATVAQIEGGRRCGSVAVLGRIARALGVDLDDVAPLPGDGPAGSGRPAPRSDQ